MVYVLCAHVYVSLCVDSFENRTEEVFAMRLERKHTDCMCLQPRELAWTVSCTILCHAVLSDPATSCFPKSPQCSGVGV